MDPHTPLGRAFVRNGGNREITVLVYLNTPARGGGTYFPRLGLRVRPRRGAALIFFPAYTDGTVDTRALHCAENAESSKWVAQAWLRQGAYAPHAGTQR